MNNCSNCNYPVPDGTKFCPSCGAPIPETVSAPEAQSYIPQGAEAQPYQPATQQQSYIPNQEQNQNINQGYMPNAQYQQPQADFGQPQYNNNSNYCVPVPDKANVGLCVLSVFIPLFGIIYFFCVRKNKPKEAKACLTSGLISAGVSILLSIVLTFTLIGGIFGAVNKALEETDDEIVWSVDDNDDDYFDEDDFDFTLDDNFSEDENITEDNDTTTSQTVSSTNTAIGTDWKDYSVLIDGQSYSLPISYSDFSSKTGYVFKSEDDANSTLKNNYYDVVTLIRGDEKIHVEILNNTGSMIAQKDGTIISFSNFNNKGEDNIIYPGNLKVNMEMTRDEIISMFGTPDDEYESDGDYFQMKWYEDYDKYYSQNKFSITLYKGKVTDISLDRGNF